MRSIRTNFILFSAAIVGVVLVLAGFIFLALFSQSLEHRVHEELKNYINQLAAEIDFTAEGQLIPPSGLSDLRFDHAYSGLYWQIDDSEVGRQLRSKSLWDTVLELPDDVHDVAAVHRYVLEGPENSKVIVHERSLVAAAPNGARMLRLAAAMDQSVIDNARDQFLVDMIPYLLALGGLLLLGTFLQVKIGLRPLDRVSIALDAIKDRKAKKLEGVFPAEIARLTDAMNDLLASQKDALERARKRSGDLAHSLKTPLTAIRTNGEKLILAGDRPTGQEIVDLSELMEANIRHELLRSKLTPTPDARKSDADVTQLTNDIVRTLKRVPSSAELNWDLSLPNHGLIAMDPHDLRELIGNIVENASKWASSRVSITGSIQTSPASFLYTVEDDGPGIDAGKIASMMERGKRFDESIPGTGIGLSIVKEIAEIYSIPVAIHNRQSSGLRLSLNLPLVETFDTKIHTLGKIAPIHSCK
ncbi:MAG: HAMP domain-containing sensor histidine kinase [Salaquimonas sp.]